MLPGIYELSLDPGLADHLLPGESLPSLRVDLSRDVFGYVLRLGCPVSPQDADPRITPIP